MVAGVAGVAVVSAATGDLSAAEPQSGESEETVDTSVVGDCVLSAAVASFAEAAGAAVIGERWSDIAPKDSATRTQTSRPAWPTEQ